MYTAIANKIREQRMCFEMTQMSTKNTLDEEQFGGKKKINLKLVLLKKNGTDIEFREIVTNSVSFWLVWNAPYGSFGMIFYFLMQVF